MAIKVNISGVSKNVSDIKVNIGGLKKQVSKVIANVGGVAKTVWVNSILLTGQTLGNFSVSSTCCPISRTYVSGDFGNTKVRKIKASCYYQNNDGFPQATNLKAYARLDGGSWVYLGNKSTGDINGGGATANKIAEWTIPENDTSGTIEYDQFYILQEGGGSNPKGLNYARVTEYWT